MGLTECKERTNYNYCPWQNVDLVTSSQANKTYRVLKMVTLIIGALVLALVHFWLLPASTNLSNIGYILSSRDNPPTQTVVQQRIKRAGDNYHESLSAFLVLCLLGIILKIDLSQLAMAWLILRAAYIPCYVFNIVYVRSIVWVGSLVCLVLMAVALV